MDKYRNGWDVAEWLERLTANAEVATVLGSSILLHSATWEAADEALLNKVHTYKKQITANW